MALAFTSPQRALLRKSALSAVILVTFKLDSGTYRFCDQTQDVTWDGNTYIGASALAEASDIRASGQMAAEPVTLTVDGNRLSQSGFTDPAALFRNILSENYHQRRVDIWFGFRESHNENIEMVIPGYAGKINTMRWVDDDIKLEPGDDPNVGKLEIMLDSLAARYKRATFRTRSHEDHIEMWPGDLFFANVSGAVLAESQLYWGKNASKATKGINEWATPSVRY